MGIIVDLILIGLIILSAWLAYMKGFTKLAISLVGTIVAVIIVLVLYIPVTNIVVDNTEIDDTIEDNIINYATEQIINGDDSEIKQGILEYATEGIIKETAKEISVNAVKISVIIILFVGIKIALLFVKGIAELLTRLPVVKQADKIGGIIYGALRGIAISFVILLVINMLDGFITDKTIYTAIEESYITKSMYYNNIFEILL